MGLSITVCGAFGKACQDCTQLGAEQCAAVPMLFGGQCVPLMACGPDTCAGCCDPFGACLPGFLDTQCGDTGSACQDCTTLVPPSTCDVSLSPRVCTSQQQQCPAPYGGCDPALLVQTQPPQKVCSAGELQNAAAGCSGGAYTAGCNAFYQFESQSNGACANCLQPFDFDFADLSGLAACAAPSLDPTCNHNAACFLDCSNQTCSNCPDDPTTTQCQAQVRTGQCGVFAQNATCVLPSAFPPGSLCSPMTYGNNFGAWLQAVGAKYCGQ
jgi:hypothetical protein